ncbi:MAG: cell division topological specificity factor MinE [Anaerolineaceae bacterium]|nr:cell division topological specificity factor MinE [Anaerolineaceae bacterium]
MDNLVDRLSGKRKSARTAKDRLKFVLIHDRINLSPKVVNKMKDEIVDVISKYVSIDPDLVQISVSHDGREQRLVADIPLASQQGRNIG